MGPFFISSLSTFKFKKSLYLVGMDVNATLTALLALSLRSETTSSRKIRQEMKMKAGKCRKILSEANNSAKSSKWGVKTAN